jgi:hypothetical protein
MAYAESRAYPLCFTLPQALTEHTTDKIDTSLRCALCARRLSRCAPVDQYGTSATAAFDASLAGMPSRPNTSSAGSTPLSSAEARAAQPASLTCAGYRPVEVEQLELRVIRQPLQSAATAHLPAAAAPRGRHPRPSSPNGLRVRKRSSSAAWGNISYYASSAALYLCLQHGRHLGRR